MIIAELVVDLGVDLGEVHFRMLPSDMLCSRAATSRSTVTSLAPLARVTAKATIG